MELIAIPTPVLQPGDDLTQILLAQTEFKDGDILAISSKAVATVEDAAIDLSQLTVSSEAKQWVETLQRNHPDPAFRQAVLEETVRLNGTVVGSCPNAMLTELKPTGLETGTILAANAGLDRSNVEEGHAIGWPIDPLLSTQKLHESLQDKSGKQIGVLLTDSCCRPRRIGVTAISLTACGFHPLFSHVGHLDLFGRELHMTNEAVADQLATATNMLMGNANECTPAVLVRDHGIELTDYCGWVPGIEPEEDLFKGVL